MKLKEHLLLIVSEEALEVSHAVSKGLRFGLDHKIPDTEMTNADKIIDELSDLEGAIQELREAYPQLAQINSNKVDAKRMRINDFLEVSLRQGTLDDEN